jgi:CIC family chloride channel protein
VQCLRWIRHNPILRSEGLLIIAILISLASGAAAVLLHRSIELVSHLLHTVSHGLHGSGHLAALILTPAIGGLGVGLFLYYLVPEARGSGIPQVKLDLIMRRGRIPFKVAVGKLIATSLAVGSGASVGREGPTVQICASLGSYIARWFSMDVTQIRTMVHAACVSGIAAAFNTPIAGMTFVMEEIIGDLNARHLSYLIFAAVGASMISRYFLGNTPIFLVPEYRLGHPAELVLYVVLGALAGFLSVAFIRLLVWSIRHFQRLTIWAPIKPALGGLLVGVLALGVPHVLGGGYPIVTDALQNQLTWRLMALLIVAKFLATVVSYSSGTAGGLFAPSLFMGAMLGGTLAGLVDNLMAGPLVSPGAFALVGMGAVFCGIIRTPLTSILIIFEMTNDYALILPLMLANMTSYALAHYLEPYNVYEAILDINEVHLPTAHDYVLLEELTAAEAMQRRPVTVSPDMSIHDIDHLMQDYDLHGFPIVTDDQCLLGMVTVTDILRARDTLSPKDTSVLDIATKDHLVYVHPDQTLNWVMQQMGERDISMVPVLSRDIPPRLVGLLTMTDIVHAFAHSKRQD